MPQYADSPAIVFERVCFSRPGGQRVLEDVSFTVKSGHAVALVGRSGAGKSTLLKLINRLLSPDSGRVTVLGRDAAEWDPYTLRRSVGYVLQDVGLFPHLSVADNIASVPHLLGWPPERIHARTRELVALVGLPDAVGDRWPDELSGGQRQRVGVARALAAGPPLLLMDEPFGALDPITRHELRSEFRRLQRQLRQTVVLVTHDMIEASLLGDHIGVIDDGRLIAWDTPAALRASSDPRIGRLLAAASIAPGGDRASEGQP